MARIEGLSSLQAKLRKMAEESKKGDASVVTGYTAAYAVYVHENLEARHTVGKAKFLEGPARRLSSQIGDIVRGVYEESHDMGKALLSGGLFLQGESQRECPVDKGFLRASAFTEQEK